VHAGAFDLAEPPAAEPLFHGQIIYLTDNVCVSACLDFSDMVLALPRVTHVGPPTSADTTYMEVRDVTLPSNNGVLNFATKVYRGSSRGGRGILCARDRVRGRCLGYVPGGGMDDRDDPA
jgi:hypothetical protein